MFFSGISPYVASTIGRFRDLFQTLILRFFDENFQKRNILIIDRTRWEFGYQISDLRTDVRLRPRSPGRWEPDSSKIRDENKENSRSDISKRSTVDFSIFPITISMDLKPTKNPRSIETFILENNSLTFGYFAQKVVP